MLVGTLRKALESCLDSSEVFLLVDTADGLVETSCNNTYHCVTTTGRMVFQMYAVVGRSGVVHKHSKGGELC